ncbi:MAG: sel1 repeat family protein [Methylococcaceae bacterium]|nr:sel1 repeat family protein [Methylococcaceae bacterium]
MQNKRLISKVLTTGFFVSCLAACTAEKPIEKNTITICDSNGCAERPKNYSSFNPDINTPDDDPGGKIAALEELAKNDPRAAYDLALRLFRGDGVRQDSYRSIKWMREAAERGNYEAQKALGRLYLTGLGELGSDPGEAEKWLTMTASRGDKEAAKLLQEAQVARQSQQAEWKWLNRWRSTFNTYWYSGYGYNSYWRGNSWYWY